MECNELIKIYKVTWVPKVGFSQKYFNTCFYLRSKKEYSHKNTKYIPQTVIMRNENKDTECILLIRSFVNVIVLVVTYLHLPTNRIVLLNEILSQVHQHTKHPNKKDVW